MRTCALAALLFASLSLASLLQTSVVSAADDYTLGPDSQPHPGVPKGRVAKFTFDSSKLFPGAVRDYWVYVPARCGRVERLCSAR
jgi:hypothetical protein